MKKTMFLFLLLWFSASVLAAQGFAASATQSGDGVGAVTLGQSVVALTGPWKFQIGIRRSIPRLTSGYGRAGI